MDNYEIARDRAQAYFLNFDQNSIICRWQLDHDESFLYVAFLGKRYAVCRKTGIITRCPAGEQAGFSEVLSIFDFLCHRGKDQFPSGSFAPVNSLPGAPKAGGVETNFHGEFAQAFDCDPEGVHRACLALGGKLVNMGDIGYQFSVFGQLQLILKFYHSDEDFPASVTLLWDKNTLQYIFYETTFYIAGFLLQKIQEYMGNPIRPEGSK